MNHNISPDQLTFYRDRGYLVLGPLTDDQELDQIRGICDGLIASGAGRKDGNQHDLTGTDRNGDPAKEAVPQLLHPSRYAPELTKTQCWASALDIAMALLDPGDFTRVELVVRDHIIVKPAGSTSPTPWHQDEAYWKDDLQYNELSVWIGLQTVTEEMGCMQFIPGTHQNPIHPHHPWKNNPKIIALEVDEGYVDAGKAVACPVVAGGATVHHCRTLHFTTGNASETPRRALILTIGTPPEKLATPRNHYWNKERRAY